MRGKLLTAHCLLLTSFLLLLSSCISTPEPSLETTLLVYRFNPPAFVEYSPDFQPIKEIPFAIPPGCGLYNTFPAPIGKFMMFELSCPSGQTVLFMDTESDSVSQPVTESDSHSLAWTSDGEAAYLKIDSLGSPQIVRAHVDGTQNQLEITEYTYDMTPNPTNDDFIFTFSRGLGYGSELHFTKNNGRNTSLLYSDQFNYVSFARFSSDGSQIAFIKIPDTQTPFTVGELWVMNSDGSNARKLADADSGHGYAANWSPDGTQIAFVVRENPEDENANQSSDALISNIYVIGIDTGALTQITHFSEGRAETPFWSPDGNTLAFNVVVNGRMRVSIADVDNAGVGSPNPGIMFLETESTCCPAWMRK